MKMISTKQTAGPDVEEISTRLMDRTKRVVGASQRQAEVVMAIRFLRAPAMIDDHRANLAAW
jgi:hypothetical protein